jgi:hypothetical protein
MRRSSAVYLSNGQTGLDSSWNSDTEIPDLYPKDDWEGKHGRFILWDLLLGNVGPENL